MVFPFGWGCRALSIGFRDFGLRVGLALSSFRVQG